MAKSVKLTNDTYWDSSSITYNKAPLDNTLNFSTQEQVIGQWIDKRPIYRKAIYINSLPNAITGNYPHNIKNFSRIIKMYGYGYRYTDGFIFNLPFINPVDVAYGIGLGISGENIQIFCGIDRSNVSAYIIMEYIKTE